MDWGAILGPALGAAIAALGGSFLGAELALSRFKRQQTYERRADWYEDAIARLERAGSTLRYYRFDYVEQASLGQLVEDVNSIFGHGKLYASVAALEDLDDFRDSLMDRGKEIDSDDGAITPEDLASLAPEFSDAATTLAKHGRRHLEVDKPSTFIGRIKHCICGP